MFRSLKTLKQLFPLFFIKKYPVLGFDKRAEELYLVELEKRGQHFQVERVFVEPALEGLVLPQGFEGCSVALALPSHTIIQKKIELPLQRDEEELVEELELRFSHYFPGLAAKDYYVDFSKSSLKKGQQSFLVMAARKEQVAAEVKRLSQLRLDLKIVDVDLYALARAACWCFQQEQEIQNKLMAVLELRWPLFHFLVFDQEELLFHQHWQSSCEKEALYQDSEFCFTQQVKMVWQRFKINHPKLAIEFFGLAGDLFASVKDEKSAFTELAASLGKELSVSIYLLNPFQFMSFSPSVKKEWAERSSSRFLLCCGLAMRGPL